MIDLLQGSHREFANIADRPEVTLVHDDGRAILTRRDQRFDVIQMSLVDTWAATGAGAFTLSENGLYTLDAWRMFLSRLSPRPTSSRAACSACRAGSIRTTPRRRADCVGLGVASLLDRGVARPARPARAARPRPRRDAHGVEHAVHGDRPRPSRQRSRATAGSTSSLAPWRRLPADSLLDRIGRSRTADELRAATRRPALRLLRLRPTVVPTTSTCCVRARSSTGHSCRGTARSAATSGPRCCF